MMTLHLHHLLLLLLLTLVPPPIIQARFPTVYYTDQTETNTDAVDFIRSSCSATRYPDHCYSSLAGFASTIKQSPSQIAYMAVSVSLSKVRRVSSFVSSLQSGAKRSSVDPRVAAALGDCADTFDEAVDQIKDSLDELRQVKTGQAFQFQMGNVQTWMSAAITNEDTCTDGFQGLPSGDVVNDVAGLVSQAKEVTSNALALVNRLASKGRGNAQSQAVDFYGGESDP